MRTCIITGASSGIGQAVAVHMSYNDDYHNLVLIGRNEDKLNKTISLMNNKKNIMKIAYDLINLEEIPNIIEKIIKEHKRIDCLLNIAGYTDPQSLLTTTIENMQKTFSINVFAPFLLIRECVKYMKMNKNGGKILNVASTAGITPRPGWLSYASSKASVIAMSQTLAEELAEYDISVYCVSPGRCATDLRRKLAPNEDQSTIMQPQEVAQVICNLVSYNENCLDGQNIIIRKKIKKQ